MRYIRIVQTPLGEAPEEVRRAWVGLLLPLAPPPFNERRIWRHGTGVLTGPKTWIGRLGVAFLGGASTDGYAVHALDAIAVLDRERPAAADWWRTNTPHLLKPGSSLIFRAEECEEVGPEVTGGYVV